MRPPEATGNMIGGTAENGSDLTPVIVLATRNGGRFLRQQLDSLLAQTVTDWTLLARDDGSVDDTVSILEEYAGRDSRIRLLPSAPAPLGSAPLNFSELLQAALDRGGQLFFCCDQDDAWHKDKLAIMQGRIQVEAGAGDVPVLLHHDLQVTNGELEPIAQSFWAMARLAPGDERRPQRLLSRNEVTGCAMACNRALLEIALPIPIEAIMHDWWLALCAAHFGKLRHVPDALVRYRQHAANAVGARPFWSGLKPGNGWARTWRKGNSELIASVRQARAFDKRFGRDLASGDRAALAAYGGILSPDRGYRLAALRASRAWRRHWLLDMTLVMRLLLLETLE